MLYNETVIKLLNTDILLKRIFINCFAMKNQTFFSNLIGLFSRAQTLLLKVCQRYVKSEFRASQTNIKTIEKHFRNV